MKPILLRGFFLSSFLLTACGMFRGAGEVSMPGDYDSYEYEMSSGEGMMTEESMMVKDGLVASNSYDDSGTYSPEVVDRKIIYTASLTLHVEGVRETGEEIKTLVEGMGGDVTDSSITRWTNSYSGWYTVRVPVDQFDTALSGLKELAVYVDSEYSNAQDVTEYYMDLETRLSNKEAEEAQYLEILAKAETVTDILSVTSYLSSVRYEIENIQGQLKYYDSQTDYSTITIYLNEDESISAVTETWKPLSTLKGAFSDWVVFLQGAVDAVIYLVIFAWPLLVLAWGIRAFLRRDKKAKK